MTDQLGRLDPRILFERMPGQVLVLRPDLVIDSASDGYLLATMTERSQIVGRGLFEVFPDDPRDPSATGARNLRASLERVASTLLPDTLEIQRYDIRGPGEADGRFEERHWRLASTPLLDDAGNLAFIIHQVEDVTDLVRLRGVDAAMSTTSRELERLSTDMERFFALSTDLFCVVARDGTFVRVNPAWEIVLGYHPDDLVGRLFIDFVHPDDRASTGAVFEQAIASGLLTLTRYENRYLHRDGSYRWLEWTGRPVPGEELNYAAARDITERKQTDLALASARLEADRANLAKSEFLSRTSHELRTPLNAVLGFAQLLDGDGLSAEHQESVDHIQRAGRHLLLLINEVLDLGRIESGRMTMSPEPVDVAGIIDESVELVAPLAVRRSVTLTRTPTPAALHVRADRQRLTQVLMNLLANGVKYNHEGGAVEVGTEVAPGNRVRIWVHDTGPGIPEDQLGRLFHPFERLGAGSSEVEGTGMGLALSKGIIEAMGGTIGIESRLGHGTTLWCELAETEAPIVAYERTESGRHIAQVPGASRTVLLIEDNPASVRLVERILDRRPGIALVTATLGAAGLELARTHRPDLLLLDLHLSDVPGLDVLRAIRADPSIGDLPVVAISADATRAQFDLVHAAGVAGYLTKPLDVHAFLTIVDQVLFGSLPALDD